MRWLNRRRRRRRRAFARWNVAIDHIYYPVPEVRNSGVNGADGSFDIRVDRIDGHDADHQIF